MGWPFGGRWRTYVGTSVTRIMEDDYMPKTIETAVLNSVLKNQSMTDNLFYNIVTGLSVKVDQAMNYARQTPNGYLYGLPNHTFLNAGIGTPEIQTILDAIHGQSVSIVYSEFQELHQHHLAFQALNESYGYNESTNEITTLSTAQGYPVYLEHIVGVINTYAADYIDDPVEVTGDEYLPPNYEELEIWETPANERYTPWANPYAGKPNWEFTVGGPTAVRFHYAWDVSGVINRAVIDLGTLGYDEYKAHFHAKYTVGGSTLYFTYEYGTGTYPTVDAAVGRSNNATEYLPLVLLRQAQQDLTGPTYQGFLPYETSKKLMRRFGLDYQQLADDLNTGPEVGNIEQACFMFGVPLTLAYTDIIDVRYIYEYFDWLVTTDTSEPLITSDLPGMDRYETVADAPATRAVVIEDAGFRMQLNYGAMSSRLFINAKVTINAEVGEVVLQPNYYNKSYTAYRTVLVDSVPTLEEYQVNYTTNSWTVKKQLTLAPDPAGDTYQEYVIGNLKSLYKIYEEDVIIDTTNTPDNLLIPLDYGIVMSNFSMFEREKLYARSMHLVINTRVTKKLEWYESVFFKGLMTLLAVVIIVGTIGQTGPEIVKVYADLVGVYGVIASSIAAVVITLAPQIGIQLAFAFVAERLGPEAGFAIAIIGTLVGAASLKFDKVWAEDLLKLSSGLVKASQDQFAKEINKYSIEFQEFSEFAEDKIQELEELRKELELDAEIKIDIMDLLGLNPNVVLGETPENFLNRTVHTNNVGTLTNDYIHDYVELTTKLPTFEDTIRGFNNELL